MKGFQTLASHKSKIAGLVVLSVGLVITIVQKLHPFIVIPKYDADKHLSLSLWIIVVGMYLTAFSQEKFEDERVKMIRAKSLQMVMMLMSATFIAFSLTSITQDMGDFDAMTILLFPSIYLAMYLAVFHIGLYFDNLWDYEDKRMGIWDNIKKNKKPIIIFQLISYAIIFLIFLLFS
ncbi:MAG: hypothetical protein JNK00_05495 [Flavipsychrobacter sp.]|nr:hypothetical protein [Flavipsychrobacter sp.]